MMYEYLILDLIILAGPLALSFDRKVNFKQYWPSVFPAIIIVAIPFILWDILVTGRHWWFNESYTLDYRFFALPLAEWLFFLVVPYACLFTWEVLKAYFKNVTFNEKGALRLIFIFLFLILSIAMLFTGKEYTGLALIFLSITVSLDLVFKQSIFLKRHSYVMILLSVIMMLIFNGYLTFRPIVLYDPQYQLDALIWTIPLEDFIYGFSLIFMNIIIFEKLKGSVNG